MESISVAVAHSSSAGVVYTGKKPTFPEPVLVLVNPFVTSHRKSPHLIIRGSILGIYEEAVLIVLSLYNLPNSI